MIVRNKNFLVIGVAKSGIAVTKYLLSKGAHVVLTDIMSKEKISTEVGQLLKHPNLKGIFGEQPPQSLLVSINYIITSPGVPMDIPILERARKENIEILNEIELSYRLSSSWTIAITGTNGKTTTTSLVGEIVKASKRETFVVGNIGTPMISFIDKATQNSCFVVEISSFQLEGIQQFHPKISAILNITPDHLNRHKTMENYIFTKSKVFSNQVEGDITILNADNVNTFSLVNRTKGRVVLFSRSLSLDEGVCIKSNEIVVKDQGKTIPICPISEIKMPGSHNLENVLAAVAITHYANIPVEVIRSVLKKFKGVEHRIELVETIKGIDFINDSKGTNPEATIKAIEAMSKPIILIAGGMDKGTDFSELISFFQGKVKHLVLLGETSDQIEHIARKQGYNNIIKVSSMESAVTKSYEIANEDDVILLSPACASWDMFSSFEERGNLFKEIVRSLKGV